MPVTEAMAILRAAFQPSTSTPAGSACAPKPSTRSNSSTPIAGSASARRMCSFLQLRLDHRVRPAARELVVAEINALARVADKISASAASVPPQ